MRRGLGDDDRVVVVERWNLAAKLVLIPFEGGATVVVA